MRLAAVFRQVLPGLPVADIGTGHGRLPIALRENGHAPLVIATESVPAPLSEAAQNVRMAGVTGVILRVGWGLDAVQPGEVEQLCLAGMGGETICQILDRGLSVVQRVTRVILQPQNFPERVRAWLFAHGLGLVAEDLVEERGHFYPVVVASQGDGWQEPEAGRLPSEVTWEWALRLGPLLLAERHPALVRQVARLLTERRSLVADLAQEENERTRSRREGLAKEVAELELIGEWLHRSPR